MRSNPALLLSYPYINGGGGLGARWLASPHISRLLKVDGFTWAPRTDSGDDVAERVDGFDSTHRMAGPAWVMHGITWLHRMTQSAWRPCFERELNQMQP